MENKTNFSSGRICLPGQALDSWTATGQVAFLDSHWGKINSVILMGDDGSMNIDFVSYPKISKELRSLLDSDDLQEEE